ncbi:MAG: hypothetical protein Q9169_003345 [Polycauliona sp. 2 TL-2023]
MRGGKQSRGQGRGHNCFSILGTIPIADQMPADDLPMERFSQRNKIHRTHHGSSSQGPAPNLELNMAVRDYFKATASSDGDDSFIHRPEIPSSEEVRVVDDGTEEEVPVNRVVGPWPSKGRYLSDHYALLREDTVAPLRNVVSEVMAKPDTIEQDSVENSQIYERACKHVYKDGRSVAKLPAQVFLNGLTFAQQGVAAKVSFSLRRTGRKIIWEQSKRLIQGSLIALSPASDMFQTICRVAVVAASHRHTLKSLQMIATETFPLASHIVDIEPQIDPPDYVKESPLKDMSSVFPVCQSESPYINILDEWPKDTSAELDESQLAALRRILTKQLAMVQGPPGTGKTHVSVVALKMMLLGKKADDPPIIVAAHTNHAVRNDPLWVRNIAEINLQLDQMLRHIAPIEPNFIRIGGRTLDHEISQRTLYEIKQASKLGTIRGGLRGPALAAIRALTKEMTAILKPLTDGKPLDEEVLKAHKILTADQCKSLLKGAETWIDTSLPESMPNAIHKWAGEELVQANRQTQPEDFGFDYEETDLEYEQLKELEAEGNVGGGDEDEILRGERLNFDEPWTGREQVGGSKDNWDLVLKKTNDLWQIAPERRGDLYRHMQSRLKAAITDKMVPLLKAYEKRVAELKIGKWELDTNYLKEASIIGCTLTGISKYRGLLHSLKPKIVLIEEAAETLEAQVTAACFDSLQHLILVGDHQQLRGQCNERELAGKPWYLDDNGQRKLILSKLRQHANLQGESFKVVTVDSYQGEENDIVLLSLVRNNENNQIGFLSVANRVCVALSRARNGFVIFGNAGLLSRQSRLWLKVVKAMSEEPRRVGLVLPLTCQKHGEKSYATSMVSLSDGFPGELMVYLQILNFLTPILVAAINLAMGSYPAAIPVSSNVILSSTRISYATRPAVGSSAAAIRVTNSATRPVGTDAYRSPGRKSPTKKAPGSPRKSLSSSPTKEPHSETLKYLTPEAQPFRDFAEGGHVAKDLAVKQRHQQLNAAKHTALVGKDSGVGDLIDTSLVPRTNELTLVATRHEKDGTSRNLFQGTYSNPFAEGSGKKQESSLLDLMELV